MRLPGSDLTRNAVLSVKGAHLDPVLHVAIIDDLQDFLLFDGQFIRLRRLETGNRSDD